SLIVGRSRIDKGPPDEFRGRFLQRTDFSQYFPTEVSHLKIVGKSELIVELKNKARYVVPTGRVVVPTSRYVVLAGKVIIVLSPGRVK
ncbi:hypothetical protein Tco_1447395, partial [Tanacetum coccineum]